MTLLQRLAAVENSRSLSNTLRTRRFQRFEALIADLPRPLRIVDLGGTPEFWEQRGWAGRSDIHITTINLQARITPHANITCECGDLLDLHHLPDESFDIAFSNSVIEHLFTVENQRLMARAMRRLAPSFWLQTPNYWFPIEPHFHVPGWQWLPPHVRVGMLRRWRCGWRGPCATREEAEMAVREVRLMRHDELVRAFPGATIVPERIAGLTKSWIVYDGFTRLAHSSVTPERRAA